MSRSMSLDELGRLDLSRRLEQISESTSNVLPSFYRTGSRGQARHHDDDKKAGKTHFALAHARATQGLTKLQNEDISGARQCLSEAERAIVETFLALTEAGRTSHLKNSAKKRQRPRKTSRNVLLAKAYNKQLALGLKGVAARDAAIRSDKWLYKQFKDLNDRTIRDALQNGQDNLGG